MEAVGLHLLLLPLPGSKTQGLTPPYLVCHSHVTNSETSVHLPSVLQTK